MDFRSGIGLNGRLQLPPPNHPLAPGLFYHLSPSSAGCQKNPVFGAPPSQLHLSNGSPRTSATIQPSLIPKREEFLENGSGGSGSGFAAALRNLAKNVAINSVPLPTASTSSNTSTGCSTPEANSGKGSPEHLAQNALLDVRKGFDRQDIVGAPKIPFSSNEKSSPTSADSLLSSKSYVSNETSRESGFQPYRALSDNNIPGTGSSQGICNRTSPNSGNFFLSSYPVYPHSHQPPYPVSYEPSPLYRTPYESYMSGILPGLPTTFPSFQQIESSSETTSASMPKISSSKCRRVKDEGASSSPPTNKKKKCLFVRPFEDDYSSQKSRCSPLALKEPVINATAYHPPPCTLTQEYTSNPDNGCEEQGLKRDLKIKVEKKEDVAMEIPLIHSDNKDAKDGIREELKSLEAHEVTASFALKHNGFTSNKSSSTVKHTALKIPSNRKRKVKNPVAFSHPPMEGMEISDSISSSPSLKLPSSPPHLNRLPESNAKNKFLTVIGLTRIPDAKKQEMEDMWNVVLEDRIHRKATTATTKYLIQHRRMNPVKSLKTHSLGFLPPTTSILKGGKAHRKTPPLNGLSKLPIDLGSLLPVSKSLLTEVKTTESPPPIIVTTTQMNPVSTNTSTNSAILNVGSSTFELKSVVPAWTSVEGVIKGYKQYHEEREKEIQHLTQRLSQLKQDEAKKRSRFDSLTTQMANTLHYKKMLKHKRNNLKDKIKEIVELLQSLQNI